MELIVLGCDGSWPGPGGACSGYLVRDGSTQVVLDFGGGAMARLQEHTGLGAIDAIFVSHAHPDHFVDLYPLSIALFYGKRGEGDVPLYAGAGFFDRAAGLLLDGTREAWDGSFAMDELPPGETVTVGSIAVTAHAMAHTDGALGFRVASGERCLAYTGDTGPTDAVTALARDTDLLVSEATHLDGHETEFHLTSRQAGAYAGEAGVARLLLTHLEPEVDRTLSAAQAAEAFGGEILVAEPGLIVEL